MQRTPSGTKTATSRSRCSTTSLKTGSKPRGRECNKNGVEATGVSSPTNKIFLNQSHYTEYRHNLSCGRCERFGGYFKEAVDDSLCSYTCGRWAVCFATGVFLSTINHAWEYDKYFERSLIVLLGTSLLRAWIPNDHRVCRSPS